MGPIVGQLIVKCRLTAILGDDHEWSGGRRKSKKKNFGGPSPGKNKSQKAFPKKEKKEFRQFLIGLYKEKKFQNQPQEKKSQKAFSKKK